MTKFRMPPILFFAGIVMYLTALAGMRASIPSGIASEEICLNGPDERLCLATLWSPSSPKAVIIIGHGVSANRGVMATSAKAFAANGYAALAMDFWGHGRSQVKFDWEKNPDQIHAWCEWARTRYPGLSVVYMGHSMGGFAGSEAFSDSNKSRPDAFVCMGALPRHPVLQKTLVAAGDFEELFTIEEAMRKVRGEAEVVRSPFSNHALETWDPVLIERIIRWTNDTIGLGQVTVFPWSSWLFSVLSTVFGASGAIFIGVCLSPKATSVPNSSDILPSTRRWSINPYRITARILGFGGRAVPRKSGTLLSGCLRGMAVSAVIIVLFSFLLDVHIFTCHLNHPPRWARALVFWLAMTPLFLLSANALDRVAAPDSIRRLWLALLTRAFPVLLCSVVLRFFVPGMAFAGMILGIFAFVITVLSVIQVWVTGRTHDYRSGAIAASVLFAWIICFWFPYF